MRGKRGATENASSNAAGAHLRRAMGRRRLQDDVTVARYVLGAVYIEQNNWLRVTIRSA